MLLRRKLRAPADLEKQHVFMHDFKQVFRQAKSSWKTSTGNQTSKTCLGHHSKFTNHPGMQSSTQIQMKVWQWTMSRDGGVAALQLAYWASAKKSGVVRLQLLPCSLLTGPAAKKIWRSRQIAVATLQLAYWACGQKIRSRQIAVAILQPSCWAYGSSCHPAACLVGLPPKDLESTDCSCYPAALLVGMLPNNLEWLDYSCYSAADWPSAPLKPPLKVLSPFKVTLRYPRQALLQGDLRYSPFRPPLRWP